MPQARKKTRQKKGHAKPTRAKQPLVEDASAGEATRLGTIPEKSPPQVAIFGAGIAGMTAAHELIERGFIVEVYEKESASVVEELVGAQCAVGGMARTQWARVQDETPVDERGFVALEPLRVSLSRYEIPFEPDSPGLNGEAIELLEKCIIPKLEEAKVQRLEIEGFTDIDEPEPEPTLYGPQGIEQRCVCIARAAAPVGSKVELFEPAERSVTDRIDYQRARAVAVCIGERLQGVLDCKISGLGGGLGHAADWARPRSRRNYATCQIAEKWLPGEHGFRFFPSFYRHVFDTMRRTPIPDEHELMYVQTPRTVLDNVSPTTFFGLATRHSEKMTEFRRQPTGSVQELFNQLVDTLKSLGHKQSDIAHFNLKLFKYMSSSPTRRLREYENITWAEFLDSEQFSPEFREYLNSTAETLVAMQATRSDARTYGNVSVQMVMDQVLSGPRTDGTLNGPTSLAWFDHWRRYLEAQGVRFVQGTLEDFVYVDNGDGTRSTWAEVTRKMGTPGVPKHRRLLRDYYVLALPPHVLQQMARKNPRLSGPDFDAVRAFNLGDPSCAETGGALEHMVGIQYFLDTDFPFLRGHIIFPDSEWRLSAISQPQFWFQHRGWWSGYRGIVSVDISNLHSPADPAWQHSREEIADGVWQQIIRAIERPIRHRRRRGGPPREVDERPGADHIPRPLYFKLDDGLEFGPRGVMRNNTPYLLSLSGEFQQRPGKPDDYKLHDQIVLAGVLMQTYTRLTSMEAANESGRHAVNAILKEVGFKGHRCDTWDPEKNEFADLDFLVDLDARLLELGLPHFMDVLDLRELPSALLKPNPDLNALGLALPMQP